MTYIVALTGGIASGKSTVANLFAEHQVDIIDADVIAREVVEPGQPALQAMTTYFGNQILLENGSLNRKHLRTIIFSDPEHKQWLNQLLHPLIQQRTLQKIAQCSAEWCLWVVPLLVENRLHSLAQRVIVVDSDEDRQIERVCQRDHITKSEAIAIIQSQATRQQRLAIADDIIDNNLPQSALAEKVAQLILTYNQLASEYKGRNL
ncbi:dephospho-CoA kinase [Rosenbergiella australiborealis]|uniref:Dephospho-CoA kinase n=1 Tax=Rosenbergiella australiborealis TaxID=1544696 RepID=A0ABS5T1K1_9GAMM|nr:dephospho-CoA kinase [Rosenbergiella australiborealis]MBT0726205.1 dephospho-CoA kinase [Rosenbergiella australiborealis]